MKRTKNINKVIGYIRVSTVDQDTAKNEAAILKFANSKDFGKVEFVSENVSGMKSWKNRKLYDVVQRLNPDDILIVPELSRLGRSLVNVLEVLNELTKRNVKVYSVKESFQLNGDDMQSKVMRTMLGLFAEIERDLISARTKEGLAAARAKGRMLGRPKGIGKSRLDEHREEIIALLKNGSQRQFIARRYKVNPATVTHWLKRHRLDNVKPEP
ncbi:MAG: recombinase family protein [Bacteroidales bacterium]|nr:recombinase family protein [Bacteroidales bacterium]